MPKKSGAPTSQMSIRLPAIDKERIDGLIKTGKFSSNSEFIARAVSDWFAHDEYKNIIFSSVSACITTNPEVRAAIFSLIEEYNKTHTT